MAEIMFETFKVPAINVAIPARLLLFVRVAEVVRRHEWPSPKSLDSDENFKHKHTLFCRNIKIFGRLEDFWATKSVLGGIKICVSWARSSLLHGIFCILY